MDSTNPLGEMKSPSIFSKPKCHDNSVRQIAIHEAGHAFAMAAFGVIPELAWVRRSKTELAPKFMGKTRANGCVRQPVGYSVGRLKPSDCQSPIDSILMEVTINVAGAVAEEVFGFASADAVLDRARARGHDLSNAKRAMKSEVLPRHMPKFITLAKRQAEAVISANRNAVQEFAELLQRVGTVRFDGQANCADEAAAVKILKAVLRVRVLVPEGWEHADTQAALPKRKRLSREEARLKRLKEEEALCEEDERVERLETRLAQLGRDYRLLDCHSMLAPRRGARWILFLNGKTQTASNDLGAVEAWVARKAEQVTTPTSGQSALLLVEAG